jgi:signal transduction histidine kinase
MRHPKQTFKASAIPDTTLRRLRTTPSYFFIIWRWSMWLYALVVIVYYHSPRATPALIRTNTLLLIITFVQSLIVTLYTPLIRFLPSRVLRIFRLRHRPLPARSEEEGPEIITPLAQTRNLYWNILIYGGDLVICGLAMYFSGPFGGPPYGNGSPFYRYGLSTVFAAAMSYRYAGGLAAALGYDLFFFIALLFPAPGSPHPFPIPTVVDIIGSLIDAPLVAILVAYFTTLMSNYAQSKKREQANVRSQRALLGASETILSEARDKSHLLQRVAEQLRQGGHFQRLVIALIKDPAQEAPMDTGETSTKVIVEANVPDTALPPRAPTYIDQVIHTRQKLSSFEHFNRAQYGGYGIARLYLPLPRDEQVQMIIGVESARQQPFDSKREEFLMIAGRQLLLALDNLRLTEQTIQLAAKAERGRIAREIHDGIAQLIYMLSLNAETGAAQAHRVAEASEGGNELVAPLAGHLDRLVTISKQALWETRNYMFSLKPLISGDTTLSQMLQNQVQEFQTISDLPVTLHIGGVEPALDGEQARVHRYAQIGTALFRIVQEALTNAYKHAEATQLQVSLCYLPDAIEVTVSDNGHGLPTRIEQEQRLYSGRGLHGMQERAEELGGTLHFLPRQEGGLQVQVRIPLFEERTLRREILENSG